MGRLRFLLSELRKARGSHYDVPSKRIGLTKDSHRFVFYHESAHAVQHDRRTDAFRLWEWARWIPWLRRIAVLFVELEASQMAKEKMIRLELWDADARDLSRLMIARYALLLILP